MTLAKAMNKECDFLTLNLALHATRVVLNTLRQAIREKKKIEIEKLFVGGVFDGRYELKLKVK
jgi:hypothetical protein